MLDKIIESNSKTTHKSLKSIDTTLKSIYQTQRAELAYRKTRDKQQDQLAKRLSADRKTKNNKGLTAGDTAILKQLKENQKAFDKAFKNNKGRNGGLLDSAAIGGALATALAKALPAAIAGAKIVLPAAAAAGIYTAAARGINEIEERVGNQRGTTDIGGRRVNRNDLGNKLAKMRALKARGKFLDKDKGIIDLTDAQMETLAKNIAAIEALSERVGKSKSLNDQLYRVTERRKNVEAGTDEFRDLTSQIQNLNQNLTQSRKIEAELLSKTNLQADLARRETLRTRMLAPWKSKQDREDIEKLKAAGKWTPTMEDIIQGRQKGGPITVPGSGSGDKVPMMLKPGSFVLNRNASNFLRRQTGGAVPTMLEPGELVYLNQNIPRFNRGDVAGNQRNLSTTDALNAAKLQKGGIVLTAGHTDVPRGQAQGTDGPGTPLQGKYKPTAEQHFTKLVAQEAARMSNKIFYHAATGKYASGKDAGANWQVINSLRKKGEAAMELHFDAYGYEGGKKIVGRRGLLSGGQGNLLPLEKAIQDKFGIHPSSGSKTWGSLLLELDTINKAEGNVQTLAKMLVDAVGGASGSGSVSTNSASGGGDAESLAASPGGGVGVQAILNAAEQNIGLSKGVSEQCANTTRAVLRAAGHPAADKVTGIGDLDSEGTKYNGKGYAASFAGSDMGSVNTDYRATKPGDVILWKDTYKKFSDQPAGAITHVGIKGNGSDVYHHGSGPGWRKQSGYPLSGNFAAGITLGGTGGATGNYSNSTNDGGGQGGIWSTLFGTAGAALGAAGAIPEGITGGYHPALIGALLGSAGFGAVRSGLAGLMGALFGGGGASSALKAEANAAIRSGPGAGGDSAKSNKPYAIANQAGFSKADWDIYRNAVGSIESGNRYDPVGNGMGGGSGGHYDGRWQLGAAAKKDAAAFLGETFPGHGASGSAVRKAYIADAAMQERYFAAFTLKNHQYLSSHPKYKAMSTREKFEVLGYAHNQGAGGAAKWLDTGVVGQDGFGTKADKYAKALRAAYGNGMQTGGIASGHVPTLLEPGEMVFPSASAGLQNLNASIPRFQNGGTVGMSGSNYRNSDIFDSSLVNQPRIIVVNSGGGQAPTRPIETNMDGARVPTLSDGPSMAGLSDIINRVSWSNVF